MKYFKTSAYSGLNVKEMIHYTIEQVYEKKIKPQNELEGKALSNTVTLRASSASKATAFREKKKGCC